MRPETPQVPVSILDSYNKGFDLISSWAAPMPDYVFRGYGFDPVSREARKPRVRKVKPKPVPIVDLERARKIDLDL